MLELASLYAGPLIGALLGDFGADVVKVEPPEGEPFRAIVSRADPSPTVFTLVSRHKRMVVADHRDPAGLELLRRLTAVADVIVANHPPAVLERMGCTYEAVAARNPRVVMVNVSGWGDAGPYADRGGNGTIAEAFSGLTDVILAGEDRPLTGALLGDCLTGLTGTLGVLAACVARANGTSEGQYVELPMFEAVMTAVAPQIVSRSPDRSSSGLRRAFPTADGRRVVATAYTLAQIERLLDAVGVERPDGDGAGVPTDGDTLAALVGSWASAQPLAVVLEAFAAARIPASPVNDVAALEADPHVRAREAIAMVPTDAYGPVTMPRPTPRLSATPTTPARVAERSLGADTAEVCADWLGLTVADAGGLS